MQHSAPVYSLADEQRARTDSAASAESAAWARFAAPEGSAELYTAWLALLALRVERARAAIVLTREPGSASFGVAAAWPDARRDLQYLGPLAQRVLERREGVVSAASGDAPPASDEAAHVGYPLEVAGDLRGAVVFDIGPGALADLQGALRQIHWASAWLVDHFRQQRLAQREAELARQTLLSEVLATAMQHTQLQPSALAVANELASRLACDRVAVGFERAGQVEPLALSNTAVFDKRADLVRWIGEAMDEVLDLGIPVAHPAPDADANTDANTDGLGALAHAESARQLGVAALLSVPIRHSGETVGVISFERNRGPAFDDGERALATAVGVMLGPVWALQRANERGVFGRARDGLRNGARELAGPNRPGLKLGAALLALLLAGVALWDTEHRVSARTVVEGSTQLAAVAPFDGFLAQALVRAGDTVKKGQPLARLDDRDLRLERSRWSAEREQLQRRWQVAQAQADRANMGVLAAQINQAEAQYALAEERIGRATLIAPYDGVVVSGDLSQQIGSPVETGKLLFEVAPLQGWRVMLEVDDRDIARLALAQRGELVLSGLPGTVLPIEVRRITPVAVQRDGRNLFSVEAAVQGSAPAGLRPGMEGVAKVAVGERSLLWIWTHGFFDWLRLALWNWLP
jgi:RND family efflux transporter MFP subunit